MDVAKEEIVKTEELETRYERYKGILKDLTIMSDVFPILLFSRFLLSPRPLCWGWMIPAYDKGGDPKSFFPKPALA